MKPNRFLRIVTAFTVLLGLTAVLLVVAGRISPDLAMGLGAGYSGYDGGQGYANNGQSERERELTASVIGTLVDESELPVTGVEVELMPVDKTGDERWYATLHDWTDEQGVYSFRPGRGEYIIAVQVTGAPDGRHPFIGTYYPGVDFESGADHIYVEEASQLKLHTVRLRRIPTVTVKVNVEFEDGTRPEWSNLLFHNPRFPNQGVIGNEAPGIKQGRGEFTLPLGYEYYARAKVDCDAGPRTETRESRPIQHLRDGSVPEEITFIIPGPACELWSPK